MANLSLQRGLFRVTIVVGLLWTVAVLYYPFKYRDGLHHEQFKEWTQFEDACVALSPVEKVKFTTEHGKDCFDTSKELLLKSKASLYPVDKNVYQVSYEILGGIYGIKNPYLAMTLIAVGPLLILYATLLILSKVGVWLFAGFRAMT